MIKDLDKKIAKALTSSPRIKNAAKYGYGLVCDLVSREQAFNSKFEPELVSYKDYETFFGYYDKFPENSKGNVLFNCGKNTHRKPSLETSSLIVVKESLNGKILFETETHAFNWQQGSRAHWLTNEKICYNDYSQDDDDYGCVVVDILSGSKTKYSNAAMADSVPSRNAFLTLNYKRLASIRPDYGYFAHQNSDDTNSIHLVSFESDTRTLLLEGKTILQALGICDEGYDYKFNHIMVNPNESGFVFMFRIYKEGVRHDHLGFYSFSDNNFKLFDTGRIVSHYCWLDNESLLVYLESTDGVRGYFTLQIASGTQTLVDYLTEQSPGDGHPAFSSGYVVTDTYPNRKRVKQLSFVDIKHKKLETVAKFYESIKFYGESRCDLHPRLKVENGVAHCYVDSVHDGKRGLYKLVWEIGEIK